MPDQLLGQISDTVARAQTVEQLTRPLLAMLQVVTGLESTYLTRVDQEAGVQNVLFARNTATMEIPEGLTVPWEDTLCKRALDEGRPFTEDASECWGDSQAARALGIRTYVSTPVCLEDGSLFGTLCAASTERRPMTAEGQRLLALFGTLIEQHVQREHLLERLRETNRQLEALSFTDPLTGLANRRFLLQEAGRLFGLAQRTGRTVLVTFIDLDGFKQINDTWGHEAGDDFLIEIGRRLSRGLRTSDLLGRIGGDEFVMIGLGPAVAQEIEGTIAAVRGRFAALVEGPIVLATCAFDYAGASLGIVAVDPAQATPEQALQQADAAMYRDKLHRRRRPSAAA